MHDTSIFIHIVANDPVYCLKQGRREGDGRWWGDLLGGLASLLHRTTNRPPSNSKIPLVSLLLPKFHSRHSSIRRPIDHPQNPKFHSRHSSIARPINHPQNFQAPLASLLHRTTNHPPSNFQNPLASLFHCTANQPPSNFMFHSRHSSIVQPIKHLQISKFYSRTSSIVRPINHLQISKFQVPLASLFHHTANQSPSSSVSW